MNLRRHFERSRLQEELFEAVYDTLLAVLPRPARGPGLLAVDLPAVEVAVGRVNETVAAG